MADALGISRNAVRKHVRSLVEAGYPIQALPRRGYRLNARTDRLDADALHARGMQAGLELGPIHYAPQLASTNTVARELALSGAPHGSLVVTDHQTAGRGRCGRPWVSPAGAGLTVSLLLRPALPMDSLPLIGLLAAVAAVEAVQTVTGAEARIKWPNDLLLKGRKIAGLLLEAASEPDALEYVIVGMGLNVNATREQLPARPLFPASSLRLETGRCWERAPLLIHWMLAFQQHWPELVSGNAHRLREAWSRYSATNAQRIRIQVTANTVVEGRDCGIDSDGALRVQDAQGKMHRMLSGDLSLVDVDATARTPSGN